MPGFRDWRAVIVNELFQVNFPIPASEEIKHVRNWHKCLKRSRQQRTRFGGQFFSNNADLVSLWNWTEVTFCGPSPWVFEARLTTGICQYMNKIEYQILGEARDLLASHTGVEILVTDPKARMGYVEIPDEDEYGYDELGGLTLAAWRSKRIDEIIAAGDVTVQIGWLARPIGERRPTGGLPDSGLRTAFQLDVVIDTKIGMVPREIDRFISSFLQNPVRECMTEAVSYPRPDLLDDAALFCSLVAGKLDAIERYESSSSND